MYKLLVLGAYRTEIEIINEAHKMGIYVIVTDYNKNYENAPAKYIADESWNISWSDTEKMANKCIENNVNGIMAGFSELRIREAVKLAKKINLPFYALNSDLESICKKDLFKEKCVKNGIRVPKKFCYGEKIEYPVIVKPVDNGGSRGITICYSSDEIEEAYKKASLASNNNMVLIEQYIKADEIMVYFTVHNGEIELSAMCDRYMKQFDKHTTQLPVAYKYPSKYLKMFVNHNFYLYKKLIKDLQINDGLIAFQSFVIGNDIVPFDPTYRLDGTMAYHIIESVNKTNVLQMLIKKSLYGTMGNDVEIKNKENALFDCIGFQLPILLGKGIIKSIAGIETIKKIENVVYVYQNHVEGDEMKKDSDFSQILCRIHIKAKNSKEVLKTIHTVYNTLSVLDNNEKDMIICRLTDKEIESFFSGE